MLRLACCSGLLIGLLLLAGLMSAPLQARTADTAQQAFEDGVAAFQAGDFNAAASYLQQARDMGLKSLSLLYNLGVAHYRAGDYSSATEVFSELLDDPDTRDLARYNRGRALLALGDRETAISDFRQVLAQADQDNLRRLAAEQLARLEIPVPEERRREWSGLVSLAAGYEDNLELAADQRLARDDGFLEGLLYGTGYAAGNVDQGIRINGVLSLRRYADTPSARQSIARLGAFHDYRMDSWLTFVGGETDWSRLDGEAVDRRFRAMAGLRRSLGPGRVGAEVGLTRIQAEDRYRSFDGHKWFLDLDYRRSWSGDWTSRLNYHLERNDRKDLETETAFFSTSPTRHRFRTELHYQSRSRWYLITGLDYRFSRYRDEEIREGQRQGRREEHQWRARQRAEWRHSHRWVLFLGAEWELNRSTLDERDYRRLELRSGIEHSF